MTAYQSLEARFKRIAAINNAEGILHWDSETMMPAGAATPRAEVLAELSVMTHELITDAALPDLIAEAGRMLHSVPGSAPTFGRSRAITCTPARFPQTWLKRP
jgi:Zn-dependent M32 family carboxypeptidase